MSITKNIRGAWIVSDIIRGYLVTRKFYGLTKREAVAAFKKETKK